MLLVDAVFVNNGGGKILLDLLIDGLSKTKADIFYLLDDRVKGQYSRLDQSKVLYIPGSFVKRFFFYFRQKNRFSSVFVFGNAPPPFKLPYPVYTYFHNVSYLHPIQKFNLDGCILALKSYIIRSLKRNTSLWFVQSELMRTEIIAGLNVPEDNIRVLPIFKEKIPKASNCWSNDENTQQGIKYIYVSDGHPYKNHYKLIEAFSKYENYTSGGHSLTLTVDRKYSFLCNFIAELKAQGQSIFNMGIIDKNDLQNEYQKADIALYPSLKESFGLGLVEAAQHELPVIAADLPYVHEIITPSAVFNPESVDDIFTALLESKECLGSPAKLKISNGLNDLINLIIYNNEKHSE
jgi:glycosyltransferase involved in cell wall biosynthesis